ncbi:Envelope glycoprotein [Lemmus lemmus]
METPTHSKSPKAKTYANCLNFMFLLPFLMLLVCKTLGDSPHAPKQLTWQVLSQTEEVIWSITGLHPPGTWWPTLTPDFCQLAAGLENWDIPTGDPHSLKTQAGPRSQQMTAHGCSSPTARCRLAQSDFYVCPQDGRNRATAYRCGGYEEYFCSQWGCETTGDAYWNPSSSWDLITVRRNYTKPAAGGHTCFHSKGWQGQQQALSLPLNITFNSQHKTEYTPWLSGKTWGLRWYLPGKDKGVILKIRLKIESPPTQSVGPNSVLSEQGNSQKKESPLALVQQRNITAHTSGLPLATPAPHMG